MKTSTGHTKNRYDTVPIQYNTLKKKIVIREYTELKYSKYIK